MTKKILVVGYQEKNSLMLSAKLIEAGFSVVIAMGDEAAKEIYYKESPDLVILDHNSDRDRKFELQTYLRKIQADLPLFVLTSKRDEYETINALEAGADDIMVKPFSYRELVARIKSLLRRKAIVQKLERGNGNNDLVVLPRKREAFYGGKRISLTPTEYKLILYMVQHRGEILSREALNEVISDKELTEQRSSLDVHIAKLREKFSRKLISTVYGLGYRMNYQQKSYFPNIYIKQHQ